jgi:hypothetical protein
MEEFEGPVVIHGELQVPGPVRPEPAAQFGSHVGVDGNLDLAGSLNILETGRLIAQGPIISRSVAQFESHAEIDGNLDVAGNLKLVGTLEVTGEVDVKVIRCAILVAQAIFTPSASGASVDHRLTHLETEISQLRERVAILESS